ncbi:MAG: phosphatase domain-containing protein [Acidimicrobiales bacterium]
MGSESPTSGGTAGLGGTGSGSRAGSPDSVRDGWSWREAPVPADRAVVFDIDGVISEAAGRQHFLVGPKRDWEGFFASCDEDPLIEETARLLDLLDEKLKVVLLTGRPLRVLTQTRGWLERNAIRWDLLIMRLAGDRAAVVDYKRSALAALREYGFDVCLGFEDDPRNREMFRAEGVHCFYIHSGYYE